MGNQRFIMALAAFCLFTNAIAKNSDNPFAKSISVNIGSDIEWVIKDQTATRSGSDSESFYHLFYDRKQLRLRITESAEDSESSAKHYEQFAVNDVLIDGKRLPVFQWCLNNQQKHKRFLQQGLRVKKGVCKNQGEIGTFSMRLNVATLDVLNKGKQLTFALKPFRSIVEINFDISDFSSVVAKLNASGTPGARKPEAAATVLSKKKCKASPPAGFAEVKSIEYDCKNITARTKATANIDAAVSKERELRKQAAAKRERKRSAAEAKKKELIAKRAAEKLAVEQAAIAASVAQQQAIGNEISAKMITMCEKKWAKGEHRCYCEKYIEYAPKAIQDSSTCSGS